MGSFITDLKNSFNRGNIYIQFIYINVGVFVLTSLLGILWMLFNRNGAFILQYLELPAWTVQFIKQPAQRAAMAGQDYLLGTYGLSHRQLSVDEGRFATRGYCASDARYLPLCCRI